MNKNGYFQSDKDGNVTKAPPKKQPPPFSGGVTSWNDLPDRPFGESVETIYDGELTFPEDVMGGSPAQILVEGMPEPPERIIAVLDGVSYNLSIGTLGSMTVWLTDDGKSLPYSFGGIEVEIVPFWEDDALWAVVTDNSVTIDTYPHLKIDTTTITPHPHRVSAQSVAVWGDDGIYRYPDMGRQY